MSLTAPAGGISAETLTARPHVGVRRYDEFNAALAGVCRSRGADQQALTSPGSRATKRRRMTTETHTLNCWHCGSDFVYLVPEELRGQGLTRDFFDESTVCAACALCRPGCGNPKHLN
jgi:hypothetical protein